MSTQRWSDDASFYGTLLELWALEEYISILEVQLPSLTEKEKHRLRQDLRADDEQGLHYTEIAEIELDEGITTRLITGSALIATWATFESAVRRAAGILGQPREAILDTSQKLFKRLGIPHPNQIKDFYSLRNALAHANGRVEDIALDRANEKRLKEVNEIERLAKSSPDIEISHDGYLSVSLEFVRDAFKLIEPLLLDLARRTDQELRAKGVSDKHPIEQSH